MKTLFSLLCLIHSGEEKRGRGGLDSNQDYVIRNSLAFPVIGKDTFNGQYSALYGIMTSSDNFNC
jgi:hypothetical protein